MFGLAQGTLHVRIVTRGAQLRVNILADVSTDHVWQGRTIPVRGPASR